MVIRPPAFFGSRSTENLSSRKSARPVPFRRKRNTGAISDKRRVCAERGALSLLNFAVGVKAWFAGTFVCPCAADRTQVGSSLLPGTIRAGKPCPLVAFMPCSSCLAARSLIKKGAGSLSLLNSAVGVKAWFAGTFVCPCAADRTQVGFTSAIFAFGD